MAQSLASGLALLPCAPPALQLALEMIPCEPAGSCHVGHAPKHGCLRVLCPLAIKLTLKSEMSKVHGGAGGNLPLSRSRGGQVSFCL